MQLVLLLVALSVAAPLLKDRHYSRLVNVHHTSNTSIIPGLATPHSSNVQKRSLPHCFLLFTPVRFAAVVTQHYGYITVNQQYGVQLFYWMVPSPRRRRRRRRCRTIPIFFFDLSPPLQFESQGNPAKDPLMVRFAVNNHLSFMRRLIYFSFSFFPRKTSFG